MVRENWFIVTPVTHSSGVSRGIHHMCKHPLNLTRLYVSGWVESSRSVLIWNAITCLGDVCMWDCDRRYDCLMKSLWLYLTLSACLIVLYVGLLLLRWSSTCWYEQMREALEVNQEEMIPLHSPFVLDIAFCGASLGLWSMFCLLFNTLPLPVRLFNWFTVGIVVYLIL